MSGTGSSFKITRLAAKYNEMQRDGRLLSNRHSIEVIRNRIAELLDRVDLADAPERMIRLRKKWDEFKGHYENEQIIEAGLVIKQMDEEFEKAYHDYMAWKEIYGALDLDRKMVESEVKISKDIQAMLTAEDAYEMVAEIFAAIMRIEDDPKKLKRYQYEFVRIVGDGNTEEN